MKYDEGSIIIEHHLDNLGKDEENNRVAHVLCTAGSCSFMFNNKTMELHTGDCMIVRLQRLLENIKTTNDFACTTIYISPEFIEFSTPRNNYGIRGSLSLFLNPVMQLTPKEQHRCQTDFSELEERLLNKEHRFYLDALSCACQQLFLDFFDFHARIYGSQEVGYENSMLVSGLLKLLQTGIYRKEREVTYYASELCVTPKHLSDVCKKITGQNASYWINRFTIIDIQRLLRNKDISFVEISDMFEFSSPAYFSRYVQNALGTTPSAFRE